MSEHQYPYQGLKEELDRTSVISDKFRSLILSYALAISQDSYERGRQFERGLHAVEKHRVPDPENKFGKSVPRQPDLHEEFMAWLEAKSIDPDSLTHSRQAELAGQWITETSKSTADA